MDQSNELQAHQIQAIRETHIGLEYEHLFESIRQQEEAMTLILNIVVTACTTLNAAIGVFVFQQSTILLRHCFLFAAAMPLPIFCLSMLNSHRDSMYRLGYYVEVFVEGRFRATGWCTRLAKYRTQVKGESYDPALWLLWFFFLTPIGLGVLALALAAKHPTWPLAIVVLGVAIGGVAMIHQHKNYRAHREEIREKWRCIAKTERWGQDDHGLS